MCFVYYLGVYLKDAILSVLNKFKIESYQLYSITSDNGANMIKAIDLIAKDILPEEVTYNSESEPDQMEILESEDDSIIDSDGDNNRYNQIFSYFNLIIV